MTSAFSSARAYADDFQRWARLVGGLIDDYIRTVDEPPVCPPPTASEMVSVFDGVLPHDPVPPEELIEILRRDVVANSTKISSPHYYGLFNHGDAAADSGHGPASVAAPRGGCHV